MAKNYAPVTTGSAQTNKSGDPVDQGTTAKGLDYDRGNQDAERGNDGAREGKDITIGGGQGHINNGHGRWK